MAETETPTVKLRKKCDSRLKGLYQARYSYWMHWRELSDFILPRRYKWLITPNEMSRGSQRNGNILDATGTIAARTLASGLMAGVTSPTRPWFKFRISGFDQDDTNPVNLWLAEVEKRLMKILQGSNFYNCIALLYSDLCVFGTAVMLIYEDFEDVIRCFNPCLGEYYLENSSRFQINVFYRDFVLTVGQVSQQFPEKENWSENVKRAVERGGSGLSDEFAISHGIEPNTDDFAGKLVPRSFPYREMYWERGGNNEKLLAVKGFHEFPAICVRWDTLGNDPYGSDCPGMTALGDIKQLQQETLRKGQAIDKMVNPPMVADIQLKNQPAAMTPGGVTYVAGFSQSGKPGFSPAYLVQPQIEHMMNDIMEIQNRIKNIFFNDLFLMISQLQTVRTATEIDARREEKLVLVGPVLERFMDEGLDPALNRVFNIANRAGLLPPPPPEISGREIEIEYVSMLAQAQRAVATSSIERMLGMAGSIAAQRPDILDKIDFDETLDEYSSLLGVPPKLLLSKETVAKIRQQKMQQAEQQKNMQMSLAAVKGAQTLSKTETGAGQNALQAMTGIGGQT